MCPFDMHFFPFKALIEQETCFQMAKEINPPFLLCSVPRQIWAAGDRGWHVMKGPTHTIFISHT